MNNNYDNFEVAFQKLREIVENYENNDDMTLDELVTNYEMGMNAYKFCVSKLEKAEQKIKIIDEKIQE